MRRSVGSSPAKTFYRSLCRPETGEQVITHLDAAIGSVPWSDGLESRMHKNKVTSHWRSRSLAPLGDPSSDPLA
jgi:hypothetical protein